MKSGIRSCTELRAPELILLEYAPWTTWIYASAKFQDAIRYHPTEDTSSTESLLADPSFAAQRDQLYGFPQGSEDASHTIAKTMTISKFSARSSCTMASMMKHQWQTATIIVMKPLRLRAKKA